ncbi:MAG: FCD domain-containing protein [Erysipelotrichaceae bacterium]
MDNPQHITLSLDKIIECFEVRSVLEGNAAFRAALKHPDTTLLESLLKQMELSKSGPEFLEINLLFHNELFRLSDATIHAELIKVLWERIPLELVANTQTDRVKINAEHKALVDALKDADAFKSENIAKHHVLHVMADCIDRMRANQQTYD